MIASCVEANSLTHEGCPLIAVRVALIGQIHKNWLVDTSTTHGMHQPEAFIKELFSRIHCYSEPVLISKIFGQFLEVLRCTFDIASAIAPLSSSVLGLCQVDSSVNLGTALINQNG